MPSTSGSRPGTSPRAGRRKWSLGGIDVPEASTPVEDWGELLQAGHWSVYGVLVDGIPHAFGERSLYTVTGTEAAPPSPDYTRSAALVITEDMETSCEVPRQDGVASGRSWPLTLRAESLEDEGLTTALFKTPGLESTITAAVSDPDDTIITVDDTTGWAEDGVAYLGLECIRYSSTSATSFEGVSRGVAGLAHYHTATGSSGYQQVTDVPVAWRGRLVTLFEHLVSPEGRYLGDAWCVVGSYCRQAWRGKIDEQPQESAWGKTMRCLPIVRVPGQDVGAKYTLEVAMDGPGSPLLWFTQTDTIRVHGDGSGTTVATGPNAAGFGFFATLPSWCTAAAADLTASLGSANAVVELTAPHHPPIVINGRIRFPSGTGGASVTAAAWFIPDGVYGTQATEATDLSLFTIPVDFNASAGPWIVLRVAAGDDYQIADVPESGTAYITAGSVRERVRYSGKVTSADTNQTDMVAVRIVARDVDGTGRADPWRYGGTVTLASGVEGSWSEVFQTLATSSGTGARGDYDRLGFGYGAGLPSSWLDSASMDASPMGSQWVTAASDERTSLVDAMGGWLALWQRCLVQRRNAAGEIVLAVVSTQVSDVTEQAITAADVLLGGHGTPELIEAPNAIIIESTGRDLSTQTTIIRDTSRAQSEGLVSWRLKCPGATRTDIGGYPLSLIQMSRGQATIAFELPPRVDLQVGARVAVETQHPRVYDWSTGTYAPASAPGVVVHVAHRLWSGTSRAVVLLAGAGSAVAMLCPATPILQRVSATVAEVQTDQLGTNLHFDAGDKVRVYEPGNETARQQSLTILSVDPATRLVTFTTSLPSWAGTAWMGYDDHATVTARQQSFMFIRSDRRWR